MRKLLQDFRNLNLMLVGTRKDRNDFLGCYKYKQMYELLLLLGEISASNFKRGTEKGAEKCPKKDPNKNAIEFAPGTLTCSGQCRTRLWRNVARWEMASPSGGELAMSSATRSISPHWLFPEFSLADPPLARTSWRCRLSCRISVSISSASGPRWFRWNRLQSASMQRRRSLTTVGMLSFDSLRATQSTRQNVADIFPENPAQSIIIGILLEEKKGVNLYPSQDMSGLHIK